MTSLQEFADASRRNLRNQRQRVALARHRLRAEVSCSTSPRASMRSCAHR
jgi:hypothetical protein